MVHPSLGCRTDVALFKNSAIQPEHSEPALIPQLDSLLENDAVRDSVSSFSQTGTASTAFPSSREQVTL